MEAKAGATDVVADTHALANKLVSGAHWTREEVAKVIERLGNGINALGQKIGGVKQAAPVKKG